MASWNVPVHLTMGSGLANPRCESSSMVELVEYWGFQKQTSYTYDIYIVRKKLRLASKHPGFGLLHCSIRTEPGCVVNEC